MNTSTDRPSPTTVSRRTIATGLAWSVPTMAAAVAAPAFAASRCTTSTPAYTGGNASMSNPTASVTAKGATGVTLSTKTVANSPTTLSSSQNMRIMLTSDTTLGPAGYVQLHQYKQNGPGQTVTYTFSQPVYNVSFQIADIDTQYMAANSHYRDSVTVSGAVATTTSGDISVSGGTATSTNTASSTNQKTYEWTKLNDPRGIATFTIAGPVTSFTITYTNTYVGSANSSTNDNSQQVYISPITFCA